MNNMIEVFERYRIPDDKSLLPLFYYWGEKWLKF